MKRIIHTRPRRPLDDRELAAVTGGQGIIGEGIGTTPSSAPGGIGTTPLGGG